MPVATHRGRPAINTTLACILASLLLIVPAAVLSQDQPAPLDRSDPVALWHLAVDDRSRTDEARAALIELGDEALVAITRRIVADHTIDEARIDELIRQTDSDSYDQRQRATEALIAMGPIARDALTRRQSKLPSAESEYRIETVLAAYRNHTMPQDMQARLGVLMELLSRNATRQALETAITVRDRTWSDDWRARYTQLAASLARQLMHDALESSRRNAIAGRYAAAVAEADRAIQVTELFPELSAEQALATRAFAQHLDAAAAKLRDPAADLDPDTRFLLQLLDLREPASALKDAPAPWRERFAAAAHADDTLTTAQRRALAESYLAAAAHDRTSTFGRALALAAARDLLITVAADTDLSDDERAALDQRARDLDLQLMDAQPVASAVGVAGRFSALTDAELRNNLQPLTQPGLVLPTGYHPFHFPRTWYTLGPIPRDDPKALAGLTPPHEAFDPRARHTLGEGDKATILTWQKRTRDAVPLDPSGEPEGRTPRNCIYFGYTEIRVDAPVTVKAYFGCDDMATVWVNGDEVWKSDEGFRSWNIEEGSTTLRLNRGINRIVFRLDNGGGAMGFSILLAKPTTTP